MNIYLFGKTSLSGEAFYSIFNSEKGIKIYPFSRKDENSNKFNLKDPKSFSLINQENFQIISFAPIWKLSYFLNYLLINQKYKLKNLKGIIACSSSSAVTKRFESNNFDKNLSSDLIRSENKIMEIAKELQISCQIIRPTMIYGSINGVVDKNISKILLIMRSLRFIILPSSSGTRQPIHALQLAEVVFSLLKSCLDENNKSQSKFITVGGDEIIDYEKMIRKLKDSLSRNDAAKKCLLIRIPNRLFLISIIPVMFFSPKTFAALSRVCANLSGFQKASKITNTRPLSFPIQNK